MLESLINPKRAEKGPWKMFFIGLVYASLSLLLVKLFFGGNPVLSKSSGILVVTFSVMFSLPFMYFIIKKEEKQDEKIEGILDAWKDHKKALYSLMWLFLGFVVAFSFWNIVLQDPNLLNAQIETYCQINRPGNIENCVAEYSFNQGVESTGAAVKEMRFLSIIQNNVYVMIFTLIFSLIFGAGAIFVLSWNASVIAGAIGIFSKYKISMLPLALARYTIHGIPEIAAYFIAALAGGMFGVNVLKNGYKNKKFLIVTRNTFLLLFIAIIIIILAAVIEVYITPNLFG